jgi:ribosomal protein L11 methylase PrmA
MVHFMENMAREISSFRDPSGFIFYKDDCVFRQINSGAEPPILQLFQSGLYDHLVAKRLLIPHEKVDNLLAYDNQATMIFKAKKIPFVSYPYEWSFGQLKDAALLTLEIQKLALEYGLSLKDASAYNVQFLDGRPIFIDLLSFEKLNLNEPWVAYRQFCQHFLAPLALMCKTNISLSQLLKCYIDGIPLKLASDLLPWGTRFSIGLGWHLHLHARFQEKAAHTNTKSQIKIASPLSINALKANILSLESAIKNLNWKTGKTEWHDYYQANNNYELTSMNEKEEYVNNFLLNEKPKTLWDLGANNGKFSRVASKLGIEVISWDIDPSCVEDNYQMVKSTADKKILPLLLDLTNPSPNIGWANLERKSFKDRGPSDCILALGLIHHLAISNNLPFELIASHFSQLGKSLIIEFVQKEDSQVIKLLSSRKDIFTGYSVENFENIFSRYFNIVEKKKIKDSYRVLYFMKRIKG